ncbi:peptidylprolyl isomerase [Patulibacter sp. SYSU D01012]|uniref:peptidylprolyl isomerase n=1 Tax=Patulibacter sp. SYSU D01012 TaxID=2817381 RepID=UPI001B30D96E
MPLSSRAARRLPVLLTAAALATGLAACGGDDDASSDAGKTTATTTATTASTATTTTDATDAGCREVAAPEPRSGEPDAPRPKPARLSGRWTVRMATNCGSFTIRLDTKRQPRTSASFVSLTKAGFFDGLTFHRISPGFVIQGGDPAGDGTGGPGYSVRETPPKDAAYTRGVVAMAKTGAEKAGTSGSQFFVVTGEDAGLPPDYAIVGKVTRGMDAVDRIAEQGTGADGPPATPIVIQKAIASAG